MRLFITILLSLVSYTSIAVSPISAKKLFRGPDQLSMQLSPDGKYVLSYDEGEDFRTLDLIDPVKEERYPLLELQKKNKLKVRSYTWVDNDTIFLSLGDRWGFLEVDYSKQVPKGKWHKAQVKGSLIAALPEQDNTVLFAYKTGKKRKTQLLRISPEALVAGDIEQGKEFAKPLEDGLVYIYDDQSDALLSVTLEDEALTFWYLKSGDKKWRSYLTMDREFSFEPVGFLNDETLAVLTNKDLSRVSLVEFDIKTQSLGEVLYQHPMYDLISAELNEKGEGIRSVAYIDHGVPKKEYLVADQLKLAEKLKASFDGRNVFVLDNSLTGNHKIVATFASDDPGHYYYYDLEKNQAKYIQSEYKEFEDIAFTAAKTFTVETDEDVSVEAILTKPASNANGVLLVFPHGGPIGIRDTAAYNPEIQFLASRGYSVLNVNFRGSKGFGKEFLESGKGQFGKIIEHDITAVVNQVQKEHNFKRMCSIGSSYGGYSAVMLAMYNPQQYECVVSLFGIYDLPLLFNASNYKTLEETRKEISEVVGEMDDSLKEVSPFYFAEKLSAPILLMAGTDDEIADFEQANRMKYRLKQLDKDIEYLFYENVGHGHNNWYGDRHMFAYIDDFIRRKLDLDYQQTEQAKETHAEDLIAIADAYNFDDYVEDDFAKAAQYYHLAALNGEGRAMFNIGSYYHQGREFDKDYSQALEWYQKSSAQGYAGASYRLGKLYHEGLITEQDADKSFEYFQKALEQEHEYGELGIAQAKCLGEGTDKDFSACTAGLFLTDKTEREKKQLDDDFFDERRSVVTNVSVDNSFNEEELTQFNKLLVDTYNLDTLNIYVDDIEFGLFEAKSMEPITTSRENSTDPRITRVPMEHGALFGAIISFDSDEDLDAKKPRTMVKMKWTTPEGIVEYSEQYTSIFRLDEDINFRWEINRDYELIEGDWRLQILTMDNKVLFDKTFTTVAKQQSSDQAP